MSDTLSFVVEMRNTQVTSQLTPPPQDEIHTT
jgi:hypothetical protein